MVSRRKFLSLALFLTLGTLVKEEVYGRTLQKKSNETTSIRTEVSKTGQVHQNNQAEHSGGSKKHDGYQDLAEQGGTRFRRSNHFSQGNQILDDFEGFTTAEQRDYYRELMSLLISKESKDRMMEGAEGNVDFVDDDRDEELLDLGFYGNSPRTSFELVSSPIVTRIGDDAGGYDYESIDLMRSHPQRLGDYWVKPHRTHHRSTERRSRSLASRPRVSLLSNGNFPHSKGKVKPIEVREFPQQ